MAIRQIDPSRTKGSSRILRSGIPVHVVIENNQVLHDPLPIDSLLPEITGVLRRSSRLVLIADPGAGKTTRVPPALLAAGLLRRRELWVAEPRRLAARLAARRVASELGEPLGRTVGYSVRFEDVSSDQTRIRYVTSGVLLRRLAADPLLEQVGAVVLDEFHERSLETDLSLALLDRARRLGRADLLLVIMSATLDPAPVARMLGGCPVLSSPGRRFPLTVEHAEKADDRPLELQVRSAVRRLVRERSQGDLLVFLPGAPEIRKARDALEQLASDHGLEVLALHGAMPMADQVRAVEPAGRRKVVLSTNVAESSITIDGVTAVVDSGLVRVMRHRQHDGLPSLSVERVSRAAADQRAGRAGRTGPGTVVRLYTAADFERRPALEAPEITRSDLAAALLVLRGAGIVDVASLEWIDPPPPAAVRAAETLLAKLGALGPDRQLGPIGRRMLRFPVHPRLARIIVEGEDRGVVASACRAAVLIGERDIRRSERSPLGAGPRTAPATGSSDLVELIELFESAESEGFQARALRALDLDGGTVRSVARGVAQLERIARQRAAPPDSTQAVEQALGLAVLSGFVDRLAKRRQPGGSELVLYGGETAHLSERSVVRDAPLLVALVAEYRAATGRALAPLVRLASAVEPEWLLEICPHEIEESTEWLLDKGSSRAERVVQDRVGSIVLEERRGPAPPGPEVARLLVRAATTAGGRFNTERSRYAELVARIELVRAVIPELDLPPLGSALFEEILFEAACQTASLRELERANLVERALGRLSIEQRSVLDREVPAELRLVGGRRVTIHYEPAKEPWIASRLQDFFGMTSTPTLCRGRTPLTLHLLAPNQRAVQVTRDLAGFWDRHYPAIRRQLMRRYPKHAWPEDARRGRGEDGKGARTADPPQAKGRGHGR